MLKISKSTLSEMTQYSDVITLTYKANSYLVFTVD